MIDVITGVATVVVEIGRGEAITMVGTALIRGPLHVGLPVETFEMRSLKRGGGLGEVGLIGTLIVVVVVLGEGAELLLHTQLPRAILEDNLVLALAKHQTLGRQHGPKANHPLSKSSLSLAASGNRWLSWLRSPEGKLLGRLRTSRGSYP